MNKGFTLVEIVIVVAIISVLACLFTPCIVRANQQAEYVKVQAEMRALSDAISNYYLIESVFPNEWNDLLGYLDIDYYSQHYEF